MENFKVGNKVKCKPGFSSNYPNHQAQRYWSPEDIKQYGGQGYIPSKIIEIIRITTSSFSIRGFVLWYKEGILEKAVFAHCVTKNLSNDEYEIF